MTVTRSGQTCPSALRQTQKSADRLPCCVIHPLKTATHLPSACQSHSLLKAGAPFCHTALSTPCLSNTCHCENHSCLATHSASRSFFRLPALLSGQKNLKRFIWPQTCLANRKNSSLQTIFNKPSALSTERKKKTTRQNTRQKPDHLRILTSHKWFVLPPIIGSCTAL